MNTKTQVTYTTAPPDYDGFGTEILDEVVGHAKGGTPVRRVQTPEPHVAWQRNRYLSGWIYLVADEAEWRKQLGYGLVTEVAS